jgi:hypothetical protein
MPLERRTHINSSGCREPRAADATKTRHAHALASLPASDQHRATAAPHGRHCPSNRFELEVPQACLSWTTFSLYPPCIARGRRWVSMIHRCMQGSWSLSPSLSVRHAPPLLWLLSTRSHLQAHWCWFGNIHGESHGLCDLKGKREWELLASGDWMRGEGHSGSALGEKKVNAHQAEVARSAHLVWGGSRPSPAKATQGALGQIND